jgi:hypothetical protein
MAAALIVLIIGLWLGLPMACNFLGSGYYLPALHFSEQYLTLSQSRAHFLRHSKGRLQRWQIFGGKPFFVLAPMEKD